MYESEPGGENRSGIYAGVARGLGRFPTALGLKRTLPTTKTFAKASDMSSFVLDAWSSLNSTMKQNNNPHQRRRALDVLPVLSSLARGTILGLVAFETYDATASELEGLSGSQARSLSPSIDHTVTPAIWVLSSTAAGCSHASAATIWDSVAARALVSKEAMRAKFVSHVAVHTSLFTVFLSTKTCLFQWLNCERASPAGLLCVLTAGGTAGAAAFVAEELFPDTPTPASARSAAEPSPPVASPRGGLKIFADAWRSAARTAEKQLRIMSWSTMLRSLPATMTAFVAWEYADDVL